MKPPLLFLCQRIPYPPFKGDKVRAWHILRHLSETYAIHLGTLVDDPADLAHIPTVQAACADSHIAVINRRRAKLACLRGLLTGEPLSVTFYRDRGLAAWVRHTMRTVRPEVVFVYSSNMAPYVLDLLGTQRAAVVDLVDMDSEKWRAYAAVERIPNAWIYRREWRRLAALEARILDEADWSTFVSADEAALFAAAHPGRAGKIRAVSNGVDTAFFDPALPCEPAYPTDRPNFVFTGAMDYKPNIDAVLWFAAEILPLLQARLPGTHFHIVGASPAPEVQALSARPGISVVGRVPDMRPFLAHATAAVAPMRIARGIQNKVLEAMAMARPVVATPDALEGIAAVPGAEVLLADSPPAFAEACIRAAGNPTIGPAARQRVLADYRWSERLRGFDDLLRPPVPRTGQGA